MKSAIQTTLLMGIMAAIFAGAAAWFYPWPKQVNVNAQVNKPLFEDYDTSSVRGIEISMFDEDRTEVDRLRIQRKGERWVIPQKSEFDVTGGDRVIQVAKSLNGRTVLEVSSDSQTDHVKFGVVDPSGVDAAGSLSSLGKKLVLSDRNRKPIGSLIVGQAVKGTTNKHYVRIPGKPTVYTIEFDDSILSTDFARWTSPNLLGLPQDRNSPITVDQLEVEKYRVADYEKATGPAADLKKKAEQFYDIKFSSDSPSEALKLKSVSVAGEKASDDKVPSDYLQKMVPVLFQLKISDVVNQSKAAVKALRSTEDVSDDEAIKALVESGFFYTGYAENGHQFDSANGQVSVRQSNGVRLHVIIGGLANQVGDSSLTLQYRVMLRAEADPSIFAEPEKPEDADDDESVKKAWLREVKERDAKVDQARKAAAEFNRKHGPWIYVMDETVIKGLLPEL